MNFAIFMLSLLSITGLICLIDILFLKKNPENNEKLLIYYCINCSNTKEYNKNTITNPKLYQQSYEVDKSFITLNNELLSTRFKILLTCPLLKADCQI